MLAQLVKEGAAHLPVIKRQKYTITKGCNFCSGIYNIISFRSGAKHVPEAAATPRCYISLGEYLLSAACSDNILNFSDVRLYHIATGEACGCQSLPVEKCFIGRIVKLDGKILAVCNGDFPRFFAVIGKKLEEISSAVMECALLQTAFTEKQIGSFLRFYPTAGWEICNGLVVNPTTKTVPGVLHFKMWLNCRKTVKARTRKPLDFDLLARALMRTDNEHAGVKSINTDQF